MPEGLLRRTREPAQGLIRIIQQGIPFGLLRYIDLSIPRYDHFEVIYTNLSVIMK